MAPPVVECHTDLVQILPRDGHVEMPEPQWLTLSIIEDGMHRGMIAYEEDVQFRCFLVFDAPSKKWPYYAYPNSWDRVVVHDQVPPVKKFYRRAAPDQYVFTHPLQALRQVGDTLEIEWGRK